MMTKSQQEQLAVELEQDAKQVKEGRTPPPARLFDATNHLDLLDMAKVQKQIAEYYERLGATQREIQLLRCKRKEILKEAEKLGVIVVVPEI